MANVLSYPEWRAFRQTALERELKERQENIETARPPLQIATTDQVLREILGELHVLKLEVAALRGGKKS